MKKKYNSPYSAAVSGGGFLYEETNILLPLLMSGNRQEFLQQEASENRLLHINAETSRKRIMAEVERRYDAMPVSFWQDYVQMPEEDRKAALFFVLLKTYRILFDFHVNVAMKKWNSISKSVTLDDIYMELNELSAKDDFVDSWTEATKKKLASTYLTLLRKVGMLDEGNGLHPLLCGNQAYYLLHGEAWFLEACLLQPYQIEKLKTSLA